MDRPRLSSIFAVAGTIRKRWQLHNRNPQSRPVPALESPVRFGEILAASAMPDFAGLPLEFWPGYRQLDETDCRATISGVER
jgi:hypothetical protein